MKIKAMVDGIEREVELTSAQLMIAHAQIENFYDAKDYEDNLDYFLNNMDIEDDDEYSALYAHMLSVKEDLVSDFRHDLNNSDEWWMLLKDIIETEANKFLDSKV